MGGRIWPQVVKVQGWDGHPGGSLTCFTPRSQRPGLPDASQRGFPIDQ